VPFQLRAIRERRGWTQEKLAEKIGTTQNTISRLENPKTSKPTIKTLLRLANAFDVGLLVRFVPFGFYGDVVDATKATHIEIPSYDEELQGEIAVAKEALLQPVANPEVLPCLGSGGDQRDQEELERVRAIGKTRLAAGVQSVLAYMAGANTGKGLVPDSIQWNATLRFEQDALKILGTRLTTLQELAGAGGTATKKLDTALVLPVGVIEITVKNCTAPGDGQEKTSKYTKPLESIRRVSFKKGEEYGHRPNHARRKPA